jgi:hypothetical protein
MNPTIAQLVEEFGMTRQAYYEMQKTAPERFQIYCDAYKYRMILKDIAKSTEKTTS